jgi:cell division protein FtsB
MNQPDRMTSKHPERNAIVILLLIAFACWLADVSVMVSP